MYPARAPAEFEQGSRGMHCLSESPRRLARRLRNARKKLREVAHLERHGKAFDSLPIELRQKMARRSDLQAEIAILVERYVEAHERRSKSTLDRDEWAFDAQGAQKDMAAQTVAEPSVWETTTVTPPTAAPDGSNHSNLHSDWDKSRSNSVEDRGDDSCTETNLERDDQLFGQAQPSHAQQSVDVVNSHPTLTDVEVRIGKDTAIFRIPEHFQVVKGLGSGSYGAVASFFDMKSNQRVAVKKVANAFNEVASGLRALREVRVLGSANHESIVKMQYFYCDRRSQHDDIYIVQELADIDLHSVIRRSGQHLNEKHHRHILYGITRGLAHLHAMDVAHRDLKPANVLVNQDCSVKICDFNLSRGGMQSQPASIQTLCAYAEQAELSDYVCTRWYRAPELMLFKGRYGKPIDMWSLGCIFCELLTSKPLFKGSNSSDQVRQIINIVGYPLHEDLYGRTYHSGVARLLRQLTHVQGKPWQDAVPGASCDALATIAGLLKFNSEKRITSNECLRQSYFVKLYRPSHEDHDPSEMDWSFDMPGCTRASLRDSLCAAGCAFVELDPFGSLPSLPPGISWADIEDDH
jgi:serine/threonine protein kinase